MNRFDPTVGIGACGEVSTDVGNSCALINVSALHIQSTPTGIFVTSLTTTIKASHSIHALKKKCLNLQKTQEYFSTQFLNISRKPQLYSLLAKGDPSGDLKMNDNGKHVSMLKI
jgi:hypothetical protein